MNMNTTLNSLGTSVASGPASLGGNVSISVDGSHHNVTGGVSDSVESSIILPNSSILQDTALILPEKVIMSNNDFLT